MTIKSFTVELLDGPAAGQRRLVDGTPCLGFKFLVRRHNIASQHVHTAAPLPFSHDEYEITTEIRASYGVGGGERATWAANFMDKPV